MNTYFGQIKNDLSQSEILSLKKASKSIKENLQSVNNIVAEVTIKNTKKNIEININVIEKIFNEIITKTIKITDQLIKDCNVKVDEIDGFILVGGSTRLALIPKKLKNILKKIFTVKWILIE